MLKKRLAAWLPGALLIAAVVGGSGTVAATTSTDQRPDAALIATAEPSPAANPGPTAEDRIAAASECKRESRSDETLLELVDAALTALPGVYPRICEDPVIHVEWTPNGGNVMPDWHFWINNGRVTQVRIPETVGRVPGAAELALYRQVILEFGACMSHGLWKQGFSYLTTECVMDMVAASAEVLGPGSSLAWSVVVANSHLWNSADLPAPKIDGALVLKDGRVLVAATYEIDADHNGNRNLFVLFRQGSTWMIDMIVSLEPHF